MKKVKSLICYYFNEYPFLDYYLIHYKYLKKLIFYNNWNSKSVYEPNK
jgi:hypothetical protein